MKVNDKVQIKNLGNLYTTFSEMYKQLGFKNLEDNQPAHTDKYYKTAVFTVFATAIHPNFGNNLVAIVGPDGEELLIGKSGLKLAELNEFVVDKEFILESYDAACPKWRKKLMEKFPLAFEIKEEMQVGTWYVHQYKDSNYLINFQGKGRGYGFYNGSWSDLWFFGAHRIYEGARKATSEEVEAALMKEVNRRGYCKNKIVKHVTENKTKKIEGDATCYSLSIDYLAMGGVGIYSRGQWAQPATSVTMKDIEDAFGGPVVIEF